MTGAFWPAGPLWPLPLAFKLLAGVNKGLCLFHLYFKPAHQLLRAQYKTGVQMKIQVRFMPYSLSCNSQIQPMRFTIQVNQDHIRTELIRRVR